MVWLVFLRTSHGEPHLKVAFSLETNITPQSLQRHDTHFSPLFLANNGRDVVNDDDDYVMYDDEDSYAQSDLTTICTRLWRSNNMLHLVLGNDCKNNKITSAANGARPNADINK